MHPSFPYLLAFLAGWVDLAAIRTFKMYASMMTGNWVNLSARIAAQDDKDLLLLVSTLGMFSLGYMAFHLLQTKTNATTTKSTLVLGCSTFILASMCAVDYFRMQHPASRWPVVLLALASGMVNSISSAKAGMITNMMTGHLMSCSKTIGEYVYDKCVGGSTTGQSSGKASSFVVVFSFCCGVYGCHQCGFQYPEYMFSIVGGMYFVVIVGAERLQGERVERDKKKQ